ncbi:protein kilB [Streptomyces sp. NPDC051567]|uniref:protein kilB n=1 Tax=Streptomyces sp. NPDC051567 TaxID=3365660 RepID=UPI0037882D3B
MWASLIAVAGTLLGSVTGVLLQQRTIRTDRAEARSDEARAARLAAVAALASALADHRRAMWLREDLRLTGATGAYEAARAESHTTRSALTAPLATLALLAPDLTEPARTAATACYALRGATDRQALTALRSTAIDAADDLVRLAAAQV